MTQEINDLRDACKPLQLFLQENYGHHKLIVTTQSIELLTEQIFIPSRMQLNK